MTWADARKKILHYQRLMAESPAGSPEHEEWVRIHRFIEGYIRQLTSAATEVSNV